MEAQEQHRRLREQAANVIANQKQTEMRLNRAMEELEKVNGNARQAVLMADEATKGGDAAKADRVHAGRRGVRQPADRARVGGREPEGAALPVDAGRRPGQGRGAAELGRAAAEALRAPEAPRPARPGEDARADEQGDVVAVRDGRRRRADARRGAPEDRGALRQGQGHVRAHRHVGREPHARDRAGVDEPAGPDASRRDPCAARPRSAAAERVDAATGEVSTRRRAGNRSRRHPQRDRRAGGWPAR